MTEAVISSYVYGYNLSPSHGGLAITASGSVGYAGVNASAPAYVFNYGAVHAGVNRDGIRLNAGGSVNNGFGVYTGAVIEGGVGIVGYGAAINVTNLGTIIGTHGPGVAADMGGAIVNGALTDPTALIEAAGGNAVDALAPTRVKNFGTILAVAGGYGWAAGVYLYGGGAVTNGAATQTSALIEGRVGVEMFDAASISNFGTIKGLATTLGSYGVWLRDGGVIVNGSPADTQARIEGRTAVASAGLASVTNFGVIQSDGAQDLNAGVNLAAGGAVVNGAIGDRSARIAGNDGVRIDGAAGTVNNYGIIYATGADPGSAYVDGGDGYGVVLVAGGMVTNGATGNPGATIEGASGGIFLQRQASVSNFGTIADLSGGTGRGVDMRDSAESLINHAGGLISGPVAILALGARDTIINYGTVVGTAGVAIQLVSASDTLVVEAGSRFVGSVQGYGGQLVLGGGVGSLMVDSGGVTVSGATATTTNFFGFDTVYVAAAASFTIHGGATLAAGQSLIDAGSLSIDGDGRGAVVNAGTIETGGGDKATMIVGGAIDNQGVIAAVRGALTVSGNVSGAGSAVIEQGTLAFLGAFEQSVTFTNIGELRLGRSTDYAGVISGFPADGGATLDLLDIKDTKSTQVTFSGNTAGGTLTVSDGAHTAHINLRGDYLNSTFMAASDGQGGVLITDAMASPRASASANAPATLRFGAAMAGLGVEGGGLPAHQPIPADTRVGLCVPRTVFA